MRICELIELLAQHNQMAHVHFTVQSDPQLNVGLLCEDKLLGVVSDRPDDQSVGHETSVTIRLLATPTPIIGE